MAGENALCVQGDRSWGRSLHPLRIDDPQRRCRANHDEDDHTIVRDDAFNTSGPRGVDRLLPTGGSLSVRFGHLHPGTFVYYCRFHARLDEFNQPVAPGPDGGVQDANGNYGTPMSGVITVLP
jgi:hypothetical protein